MHDLLCARHAVSTQMQGFFAGGVMYPSAKRVVVK
jgi:hypothetical protein